MLKLDTEIHVDIPAFLRWWGGELRALLPDKVRQIVNESRSLLIIEADDKNLAVKLVNGDSSTDIGNFQLNDLGKSQFRVLLNEQQAIANAEVLLRMPAKYGVVKQIYIPDAAAANLQQVITYELDRYTPFVPEQVYFDYVVLDRDKVNKQLKILLILMPIANVRQLLEEVKDWGLQPSCLDCAQEPSTVDHQRRRYNLLPVEQRRKKDKMPKVYMFSAMGVMLLFLGAVLVAPLWLDYRTVDMLRDEARKAENQARKVNAIKEKIELLYDESKALIGNKSNEPSLVELLEFLSAHIKDDTWLTQIKFHNGSLHIQGLSPSASSLIGSLEGSELFDNTRFVSPVTEDRQSGLERFQIATQVIAGNADE